MNTGASISRRIGEACMRLRSLASFCLLLILSTAQAVQPQLEIHEAYADPETGILEMIGVNFDNGSVLEITLAGRGLLLRIVEDPPLSDTNTYIKASLPAALPPGTYTIVISSGGGLIRHDEIDFTYGAVGETGLPGIDGIDGIDGAMGLTGPEGPQGVQGPAGSDGKDGSNGTSCSVSKVLGVATIACADGFSATVSDGADGEDGATGTQGPVGPQGPSGPQGPAGITNTSCPVDEFVMGFDAFGGLICGPLSSPGFSAPALLTAVIDTALEPFVILDQANITSMQVACVELIAPRFPEFDSSAICSVFVTEIAASFDQSIPIAIVGNGGESGAELLIYTAGFCQGPVWEEVLASAHVTSGLSSLALGDRLGAVTNVLIDLWYPSFLDSFLADINGIVPNQFRTRVAVDGTFSINFLVAQGFVGQVSATQISAASTSSCSNVLNIVTGSVL